jgi:hypothetical protein
VPTIAVDFDGVIHAYSKGWSDGSIYDPPLPGAIDGLRALMRRYAVVVFTTRSPVPVARWLQEQAPDLDVRVDVPGDPDPPEFWDDQAKVLVTNRKLPAVAYIDDRAVRFVSWVQTMVELQELEAIGAG